MSPPRCLCGAVATGQVVEGRLHPYCAWREERARAERYAEALRFYAEHTHSAFRGTTGEWVDYDRWPQPRTAIGGEPSMWDNGQIAQHAIAADDEARR